METIIKSRHCGCCRGGLQKTIGHAEGAATHLMPSVGKRNYSFRADVYPPVSLDYGNRYRSPMSRTRQSIQEHIGSRLKEYKRREQEKESE